MTSIFKKVFRGSSKRRNAANVQIGLKHPECPPSPDLSGLTEEEISVLKDVFRREEEFESEIGGRQQKLRESLLTYEDEVKRHASHKYKLKHVDLRLCRLCYKTKFADGIGKACTDCNKRVCNRCGSFSQPTWNAKKQKFVKGKWRCTMCQMKRDVVAMTGVWYHGGEDGPAEQTMKLKSKISHSEIESSDSGGRYSHNTDHPRQQADPGSAEEQDDYDVFSDETIVARRSRRRSVSYRRRSSVNSDVILDDADVENEIDVEQFQWERHLSRKQRQSKHRKRGKSGSLKEWPRPAAHTDQPVYSSGRSTCEGSSTTDCYVSSGRETGSKDLSPYRERSKRSSSENRCIPDCRRDNERFECSSRVIRRNNNSFSHFSEYSENSGSDYSGRHRSVSRSPATGRKGRKSQIRSKSFERKLQQNVQPPKKNSHPEKLTRKSPVGDNNRDLYDNQNILVPSPQHGSNNADYAQNMDRESRHSRSSRFSQESQYSKSSRYSRESQFSRESRCSRESRFSQDSSPSLDVENSESTVLSRVKRNSPTFNTLEASRLKLLESQEVNMRTSSKFSDNRQFKATGQSQYGIVPSIGSVTLDISNYTSRDIGDVYHSHKRKPDRKLKPERVSSTNSLSPDMALLRDHRRHRDSARRAGSTSPKLSALPGLQDRRNTLPDFFLGEHKPSVAAVDKFDSYKPRDILLHRNKSDKSVRTQGLGMRIVGGTCGPDGVLGAYVTMVIKGGSADSHGISEGDQILEWNGHLLTHVTFEETQGLIKSSGDIVQITVLHRSIMGQKSPAGGNNQSTIINPDDTAAPEKASPDDMALPRQKRRMLPKTPVEIKRDVRHISGRLWIQLDYDISCQCLLVVLLRGEGILSEGADDRPGPNVVVMLHLLPNRNIHEGKESEVRYNARDPHWNETFVFANVRQSELKELSLEMTAWNCKELDDEFLGEILLDLGEANIDNSLQCYNLEDHDENSSPLPYRKRSFSLSDSAASPVASIDTSSFYPSREPSPRSSVSTKDWILKTPSHERKKDNTLFGKKSPGRDKTECFSSSAQSSPVHSPTSTEFPNISMTSLVKRKLGVVAKMSNTFGFGSKRESDTPEPSPSLQRSQSETDMRDPTKLNPDASPQPARRSFTFKRHLLAPPQPLNTSSQSGLYFDGGITDTDTLRSPNPDRPAPEGDDITSLLGPGQVTPKPSFETSVCGDIKMGFTVSKGQLEIDIVVVKGLSKTGLHGPPDTYVKTYLVQGAKTVQKKKTQTVRMSFDPIFRKTIKYSACNIHGRCIKVNVWEKQKAFDRKQCLGEAVVKLDNLDLSQHTMAWYKLFPVGATEIGSCESLTDWSYH